MVYIKHILIVFVSGVILTGCATSKRGAKQDFFIKTNPPGARVETTILDLTNSRISDKDIAAFQAGVKEEPSLEFLSCEPTPCSFKLARKMEFDVLVSMKGYESQTIKIDHFHRKDIAKEINKEVALTTAVAGTGAAALGAMTAAVGVNAATFGTATASTGTLAAGAAIAAAPIAGIALISMGVDSSTGANYDYWPNPVKADMKIIDPAMDDINDMMFADFDAERRRRILRPPLTKAERQKEKAAIAADRKHRLANDRLFKDYAANLPPEPVGRPQSGRAQRRAAKEARREAGRRKSN